jgi:hypothetical protein
MNKGIVNLLMAMEMLWKTTLIGIKKKAEIIIIVKIVYK